MEAQRHVGKAQVALNRLLVAAPATSRAGHLRALPELIGPPPNDRTWQDEWVKLKAESYRLSGQGEETVEEDEAYVREHDPIDKYIQQEGVAADIQHLVDQGWPPDRAQVYALLFTCVDALGRALGQRDPCYSASMYALCEALFAQRQGAEDDADVAKRRMQMTPRRPDADGRRRSALPQPMYAHLHGLFSLAERDPAWESLETPDGTGFRGLTSSALVHASWDPRLFTEAGFSVTTTNPQDSTQFLLVPQDSDVVCFVSMPDDEHGAHSAIVTADSSGDFPPNTLFRLKNICDPGGWEAPGGVRPMQRLLEVTATYQPPHAGLAAEHSGGSKMCGSLITLSYNRREAFLSGLDDLIAKPALTMQDEFSRPDKWTDWKGVTYTAQEEWGYVNGPAQRKPNCTPGTRDDQNNGKTPQQFMEAANDYIRRRRDQDLGTMLTDEHAYLNLEEVLAVRLYTGPAYQPINAFLRQVSSLTDTFRAQVGQHPGLTYAATVGHICRAIRKLAAVVTHEEASHKLWRGVRGELERAFWLPDTNGKVCAVDMAFMSTSRDRTPPIEYMDAGGSNVLWQLHPTPESDSGFHRGANVEVLSQFAGEAECLFPPCTMLVVREEPKLAAAKRAGDRARMERISSANTSNNMLYGSFSAKQEEVNGKEFLCVDVLPIFL